MEERLGLGIGGKIARGIQEIEIGDRGDGGGGRQGGCPKFRWKEQDRSYQQHTGNTDDKRRKDTAQPPFVKPGNRESAALDIEADESGDQEARDDKEYVDP